MTIGAERSAPSTARLLVPLVIVTSLRLWLASGQMLTAVGFARYDDRLFLTLGQHIAAGRWLGPFDNATLVKGPFYPMWIAASFLGGIPLMLSQNLLYVAACLLTIFALRPVVRSVPGLVAIYAVLLFNPVMFAMTRVLRDAVYVPLTLLLAACLVGLFLRRADPLRPLTGWACGAGLALSAMWLTRGDSIWVLPSVLGLLAVTALSQWGRRLDRLGQRVLILVTPLAIWGAAMVAISTTNLVVYGAFVTTEVAADEWLAAYGALSRVEGDSWQRYIVVPRHVRERIYRVSPAFAELRPALEGQLGRDWALNGCRQMSVCDDVAAGWFMWLLRDAVAVAGHYRSAPAALGYYRRLGDEVNAACDAGRLRCGPPRATMAPPWRPEYRSLVFASLVRALRSVVGFDAIVVHSAPSLGNQPAERGRDTELRLLPFRWITRDRLMPTEEDVRLRVDGWGFGVPSDLRLAVEDAANTPFEVAIRHALSPDVFAHFVATEGRQFERARDARFTLWTTCLQSCRLVARLSGQDRVLGTLPLDGTVQTLRTPELRLHVQEVIKENARVDFLFGADALKVWILIRIARVYQYLGPALALVVLVALAAGALGLAAGRRSLWLIPLLTVTVALVARAGLIALVDATSFTIIDQIGVGPVYLGAVHALLVLAGVLACIELNDLRRAWLRRPAFPPEDSAPGYDEFRLGTHVGGATPGARENGSRREER
jgi:hypothetical protein